MADEKKPPEKKEAKATVVGKQVPVTDEGEKPEPQEVAVPPVHTVENPVVERKVLLNVLNNGKIEISWVGLDGLQAAQALRVALIGLGLA